jgi:hypothetical protein
VKRMISAVAVLLFIAAAAPVFALDADPQARHTTATIVDEVIRMSQAGVADEDIVAYVHKSRDRFDVSADDLIALTDAKVSKAVIHAVVDEADVRNGDGDRGVRRSTTVVRPSIYVGSPWFYNPYYYYDPFWYQPRLSLSFGFGHFGGRYYGGSRGHGGGHGGGGHHRR